MLVFRKRFRLWLWLLLVITFIALLIWAFSIKPQKSLGATGEVTIQPGAEGKDSFVFPMLPGTHGNDTFMYSGGGSGMPPPAHAYLQFDLSSIPSGATINSANLYLYFSFWVGSSDTSETITANKVTGSWDEATIVWGSEPSYNASPTASTVVGDSSAYGWYSWNITSLVSGWMGGGANYGVVLKDQSDSANTIKSFHSSDSGSASLRPKLVVNYTTSGGSTPPPDTGGSSGGTNPSNPINPGDSDNPDQPVNPDDQTSTEESSSNTGIFGIKSGGGTVGNIIKNIVDFTDDTPIQQVILVTAGAFSVISTLTVLATTLAAQAGIKELIFIVMNYIFSIFAVKKKTKEGMVYDQTTKKAVAGAVINIYQFETMKLVASAISDRDGRYFFTVKPGDYVISVIKKGFIFPSHFANRERTVNEDVYYGQTIKVGENGGTINYKIPIDPTASAESSKSIIRILLYSTMIRITLMIIGTAISLFALYFKPITINYIMVSGYVVLWIMEYFVQHREVKFSKVIDADTKQPIDLAMSRVVSNSGKILKTYVSDFKGRFIPLIPEDNDFLVIDRVGYQELKIAFQKKGFVEGKTFALQKK